MPLKFCRCRHQQVTPIILRSPKRFQYFPCLETHVSSFRDRDGGEIHITLRFSLENVKVGLTEIIYKPKDPQNPLILKMLREILTGYDELISECLSLTDKYPEKIGRVWGAICGAEIHKSDFVMAVR